MIDMRIENSTQNDIVEIFELYNIATTYMKSKKQVAWPEFSKVLIETEINDNRQWKIIIDGQIACIWATTTEDALIWGDANTEPSIYIHRIATNPNFRGRNLVQHIVQWAESYCSANSLKYIRMDTVGNNQGLINHYTKLGFRFLGHKYLENTNGLPEHYNKGPVCLFQRKIGYRWNNTQ